MPEYVSFLNSKSKSRESRIYEGIRKVDSQKFYKSIIVKCNGDERTKAAHKSGAHGALADAENLCSVSTGRQLLDRFKDWLMFERSEECEEEEMMFRPAMIQSISSIRFRPG